MWLGRVVRRGCRGGWGSVRGSVRGSGPGIGECGGRRKRAHVAHVEGVATYARTTRKRLGEWSWVHGGAGHYAALGRHV
jgi:hypothetical protein